MRRPAMRGSVERQGSGSAGRIDRSARPATGSVAASPGPTGGCLRPLDRAGAAIRVLGMCTAALAG